MPCSHCSGVGHNYVTCPNLTREQIQEIKEKKKQKKLLLLQKREEKIKAQLEKDKREKASKMREYKIVNDNMYEVVVYWGWMSEEIQRSGSNGLTKGELRRVLYIPPMEDRIIKSNHLHRIVIFPTLEVLDPANPLGAYSYLINHQEDESRFKVFDMDLVNYPDTNIEVKREYTEPKSELEQWKEVALKSNFLLTQIAKITGGGKNKKFELIEPFIDMVKDIKIPEHGEEDKERAGVPSSLTNIT